MSKEESFCVLIQSSAKWRGCLVRRLCKEGKVAAQERFPVVHSFFFAQIMTWNCWVLSPSCFGTSMDRKVPSIYNVLLIITTIFYILFMLPSGVVPK